MAVMLQFPLGDVVIDLYDEGEPAKICESFTRLCARKYYHGCLVYQGNEHVYGSQFFFTLRDEDLDHLDAGGHVVIGEVAEGLDVLKKLGALYLDSQGRPWEDVRIQHTHVLENPFAPCECPPSPDRKPETPHKDEKVTARVAYGQAKDAHDGLTAAERASQEADKKARSQAEVLEMIGDLPHADVRRGAERSFEVEVPKNELFIAKLNKATEDADLELIFSRFGRIESCDIVRDWKTGDSLNFAFIAFEEEKSCVEAYKKMNNVLIDDSRIRVDFSQSVAKIWSRYTMQYKGSAAAKLREKHRKGGSKLDVGHYGPGGPSQRAYGGRSGEDVYAADHVRDYRGRLDDRDRRRGDRRDPGRSLGIEGLDDRRRDRDDRDRSRRDRDRSRRDRDRDRERRKRSRSRERSRRH